jgi:hypothetical protein
VIAVHVVVLVDGGELEAAAVHAAVAAIILADGEQCEATAVHAHGERLLR